MTAPAIDSSDTLNGMTSPGATVSVSAMQATPQALPAQEFPPSILATLPDVSVPNDECPRRTEVQIDLLLLAIEALDLTGSEAILITLEDLELQGVIRGRVGLWKVRSTNPLRRFSQRRSMTVTEAKALVVTTCYLARRLTVLVRQLVLAHQQSLSKGETLGEGDSRLTDYLDRFRAHYRHRMNIRRVGPALFNSDAQLNDIAIKLLSQLLFCTGTAGMQRLWISLFDGEVA
jgi:hypothetical protein